MATELKQIKHNNQYNQDESVMPKVSIKDIAPNAEKVYTRNCCVMFLKMNLRNGLL